MIYINDVLVDFRNNDENYRFKDIVADYNKTIQNLKECHGNVVLFKTKAPIKDPKTGNLRPYKPYSWPNKLVLVNEEHGTEVWKYSRSGALIKDGAVELAETHFQVLRGSLHVNLTQEADFAFFLTKHDAVKSGRLKLHDSQKINDELAEQRIKDAKFHGLLYNPDSPLFSDRKRLRMIAQKWGISDVDALSDNEISSSYNNFDISNKKEEDINAGWDISHARRFVHLFTTLYENKDITKDNFPEEKVMISLANQVAYGTFNRDFNKPLFTNFMDGTNGWYRVDYNSKAGFGYAPYDLSSSIMTGGYGFFEKYNSDIRRIMDSLWNYAQKEDISNPYLCGCYLNYERGCCNSNPFNFENSKNLLMFLPSYDYKDSPNLIYPSNSATFNHNTKDNLGRYYSPIDLILNGKRFLEQNSMFLQ